MSTLIEEIRKLSVSQRVQLVEDIWDTLSHENADLPLSEAQMAELDTRRDQLPADPSMGISWETAKARLAEKP
jgi:putative addiction module component (TIGR02574 family)